MEDENGEKLAPMWTPVHPLSKAAAIEVLFPRKVEAIGYVPEELPPSQVNLSFLSRYLLIIIVICTFYA